MHQRSRTSTASRRRTIGAGLRALQLLGLSAAVAAIDAAAADTIYRCTDASGMLTVQTTPCPAGSTQQIRQMQGVASSPDAAVAPAAPAAPDVAPPTPRQPGSSGVVTTVHTQDELEPPRILDSATLRRAPTPEPDPDAPPRPPPPPVYRCTTYDNDSYLSEEQTPAPRCIALRTVGLDGNPDTGAGQACEVKRDQCVEVTGEQACDAWARLAREAETRFRFAHPDNAAMRRGAHERLVRIIADSSCGG